MIIETIVVTPFAVNCYIVGCLETKEALVIDPGGEIEQILDRLQKFDLIAKLIVGTHAHIDHAAGVEKLKQTLDIPYLLHRDEEVLLQRLPEQGAHFNMEVSGIPQIDRYIKEGDILKAGKLQFKILETPGHSPCGICVLVEGKVFTGDTIFERSIGRTDLYGGDYDRLLLSITNQLLTLPDDTVIYPGHGPATTIGAERRHNPFLLGV